MSQTRHECRRCRTRIAVERGIVRTRISATTQGDIVGNYDNGVMVKCLACGSRRFIRYTVKRK